MVLTCPEGVSPGQVMIASAPNGEEVSECFTVELATVLKKEFWDESNRQGAHVFTGAPYPVWGLTAYILKQLIDNVFMRYRIDIQERDEGGSEAGGSEKETLW